MEKCKIRLAGIYGDRYREADVSNSSNFALSDSVKGSTIRLVAKRMGKPCRCNTYFALVG